MTKGIILAGGTGSRLWPVTFGTNKHLLPVYDKPMIYYPLSVLMLAGIREVMFITTPADIDGYRRLFGDGSHIGMQFEYAIQEESRGIADAFLIARDFIAGERCALILGDNIFIGGALTEVLQNVSLMDGAAITFCSEVPDPERFGVVRFDEDLNPVELLEKPVKAPSNWAVTGLYFYDHTVADVAAELKPSARGELEITDLNNIYLKQGKLKSIQLGRGTFWLDAGTPDSLLESSQFVRMLESRHASKIGAIEEIAWRKGFINTEQLRALAVASVENAYGSYLRRLAAAD